MTEGRGRREGARIGGPRSVTELAHHQVRARILSGELAQGAHIAEQALADELRVGRAALREALRLLEHDGLVRSVPRAGSRVVALTLRDAYEIVTLREHLEHLAVTLGLPVRDPRRLIDLETAVAEMEAHAAGDDEIAARTDGIAVHRALIALPGHGKLAGSFDAIAHPLTLLMSLNRRTTARAETLAARAARHRRIAELAHAGDASTLLAELRSHRTHGFLAPGLLPIGDADATILRWVADRAETTPPADAAEPAETTEPAESAPPAE